MSKKRVVNKKHAVAIEETQPAKVNPLMKAEGQFFQELVNSSNRYADLMKQESQYKFIVARLESDRKKIQKGEIKLPITMTLIPKVMSYQEDDKKKVLAVFDEQIAAYNTNLVSLKGQMEHRYEDFLESAARNKEFLAARFKNVQAKKIVPLRDIGEKDEEVLFESQFKDLVDDSDKQAELKAAKKEAIKRNTARKTKA